MSGVCVCVRGVLWGREVAKGEGIEADLVLCGRCLGNFGSVDVLACSSERTLIGVVADFGASALNLMCGGLDL